MAATTAAAEAGLHRIAWQLPTTLRYKTELIKPGGPWRHLHDVEYATLEYVDWYNNWRLHGEIGHLPPAEYEAIHYRQHHSTTATTVN